MKIVGLGIGLVLGWMIGGVGATTVSVGEHECPVCGRESKVMKVGSYSRFGEPARDLSDQPMFGIFGQVETCPWDLYATWGSSWEIEDEKARARLRAFLAGPGPKVELTDAERKLLDGKMSEFRESGMFAVLWVRTCNKHRAKDARRDWFTAMQLFYLSQGDARRGEWVDLHAHYRAEAIRVLAAAGTDGWASDQEKLVFPYLRAELLRQAGRMDEARKGFAAVETLAETIELDPEGDHGWVVQWAREQGWRIEVDEAGMDALTGWVVATPPNPWREEKKLEKLGKERWARHAMALDALVGQALEGDQAVGDWLWELVKRDAGILLAVEETLHGRSLAGLRGTDQRWGKWFDELAGALKAGLVPKRIKVKNNQERNVNVLGRVVNVDVDGKVWLRTVLLPAVRDAEEKGRTVSMEGVSRRDLIGGLKELVEEGEVADAKLAARMAVQLMKAQDEDPDLVGWPIEWLFRALCERRRELGPEVRGRLDGEWKSEFWKALCEYVAGQDGGRERLVKHPLVGKKFAEDGKVFENLLWACFAITKDPVWVDQCVKELGVKEWRNSEVLEYGQAIPVPRLREALMTRHAWLTSDKSDGDKERPDMMFGYEAQDIEEGIVERKMRALGVSPWVSP